MLLNLIPKTHKFNPKISPTAAPSSLSLFTNKIHNNKFAFSSFPFTHQRQRLMSSQKGSKVAELSNAEVLQQLVEGKIQQYQLEKLLNDGQRAVLLRRLFYEKKNSLPISKLPHQDYDYSEVVGVCCENVIGYLPVPVGLAGPLLVDGVPLHIPMATTEGTLVASTHRGCKVITNSGGSKTEIYNNGMTRAPVIKFPSAREGVLFKCWLEVEENFARVKRAFDGSSRFAKLLEIKTSVAGNHVFPRFKSSTSDAMGMNMVSKGVERALAILQEVFPEMRVLSLSGNVCTDKKPSSVNWTSGRGKSVVAEVLIPNDLVKSVLKTTIPDLVELFISKNMIGSALAGSIGGNNAHAANIVTAIFLATGQDVAQNVESSNCMTIFESVEEGKFLRVSCTMPSLEVGTIGGGTHLKAQSTCLEMLGVKGTNPDTVSYTHLTLPTICSV
eukprot:TRINITY_DN1518_c0_g1_i4.p1 TRINITY_DN1518_c0_g1~~TRINITY_DN1518_c0_g1_i4.p1  ORF type:complete len:443 (-),score=93.66 TRINITY_DN1518_c0_g1_i4:13-1341(-)